VPGVLNVRATQTEQIGAALLFLFRSASPTVGINEEVEMERTRDPAAGAALVRLAGYVNERSGRLEASALRSAIAAAVADGHVHVVLDLRPVGVMDAEALGELAANYKRLQSSGGSLALFEPQERVRRLLSVTRLDTVLPVRVSEAVPEQRRGGSGDVRNSRLSASPWSAYGPTLDWRLLDTLRSVLAATTTGRLQANTR
jgi:anti-sigma B factor antagonist